MFVAPNGDALAGAAAVFAPKENVLPLNEEVVVTGTDGIGVPNEMPAGFGAPKLNVGGAAELKVDVVVDGAVVDELSGGFTVLPNENVAIDCALVVGSAFVAVVAITPNV